MAEPDGQGGIRQAIRLFLDKTSLTKVATDAKAAAQQAATQMVSVWDRSAVGATKLKAAVKALRDEIALVKIPPLEDLNPSLMKTLKKGYAGDKAGLATEIKRQQMAQQMHNTTFTLAGQILQRLGVNVYQASGAYRALSANLQNVGKNVPVATAGFRTWINEIGGKGLSVLRTFAGQLGIAFSVYRLVSFAKSAVTTAGESQAAWARLSSTLSDFGLPLSKVQGQIEEVVTSQSKLGVKQQDTVETLATLINISGDYAKSLQAVTVVTDLMIARHFTQEQAARAVGRAMIGDNMLLSRQGIILDKNRDAIEQLTERMRGEMAARATTLAGKIQIVSSAFNDLKIAIGNALTQKDGSNWASQLVDALQSMTTWVKQNSQDFQVLAEVLAMVVKAVGLFGMALMGALKLAETIIGSVSQAINILGISLNIFETRFEVQMLRAANTVVKAWDWVFKTHHDGLEKMIKEGERVEKESQKQAQGMMDSWRDALKDIWAPEAAPSGPKAPDFALGTAGKIKSREQSKLHANISQLGNIGLHGRPDDAVAAMEKLNKLMTEQEQLVSELGASDELKKRNVGAIQDAEDNIAKIKKIQLQYDKLMDQSAKIRREDAHDMQEIERLGRVAREADLRTQGMALAGLDRIQARLLAKQAQQQKYGERWFILQNMIDQIEHQREERATKEDKTFKDTVDKLHDRLVLHVEEEAATKTLEDMVVALNLEYQDTLKIVNQQERAEAQLHIARRRRLIEQALLTEGGMRDKRITTLEKDLEDPAKRKSAEQQLLSISKEINNELTRRRKLNIDVTELEQEQERVQNLLRAHQHTAASDLSKMIGDAKRLGKEVDKQDAAAQLYQAVIDDINKQLDGQIKLTVEEKAHLIALLETAKRGLTEVTAPSLNMWQDMKDLWQEVGLSFEDNVAKKIADSWTFAAELMLHDLHDMKKAATTVFQGMGKAFAAEIKSIATLRVKQHIAEAVSEVGEAFKAAGHHDYASMAAHLKSAGSHTVAAAKWALLAGAAGDIGGKGVSGLPTGGYGNRGQSIDQKTQGPIIYLRLDGVNPNDPRHQEIVGATIQKWEETQQGAQVVLGGRR